MKILSFIFWIALSFQSFSQLNMNQLSNVNFQNLHNANLNDIWGYVDENGNEYALVGTTDGTSVVNVSIPNSPSEVFWLPGMNSLWRDIKTWGDFAYVTTEASQGLTIIDMSSLPASSVLPVAYYNGEIGNEWASAHNLYIDSCGFAYIFGANRGNGGVIILDVHTDPMAPIEVGVFDNWYAHDGFVRNDTLFGAHINDGIISMVDITDKANPVLLGTKITTGSFAHNIWVSNDGLSAFTTDEKPAAFITAYDVSDETNIVELDKIQSSPGTGVIPHNTHVFGDYIVTSYYRDGVRVHDVSRPHNLTEVAHFDTSPLSGTGYNGCWGVYPFLPSGNIIASDMEEGLYVLGISYQKGCYVEGIVTDSVTNLVLSGVRVEILSETQKDISKFDGSYAVSTVNQGNQMVKFTKVGYETKILNVNLTTGGLVSENVELVPLPEFGLTILVKDQSTNSPIENAQVRLVETRIEHNGITNALGEEDFSLYYTSLYNVIAGKWGYKTSCVDVAIDNSTGVYTVFLEKGIYDDFTFDFGWSTTSTATEGDWVRDVPIGYPSTSNASVDADFDCSNYAYVTGNLDVFGENEDDVDNGTVVLISPSFDLTTFSDPFVNFATYFYNYHGTYPPDDKLEIFLNNGTQQVLIHETISDSANSKIWLTHSIRVLDFIAPTNSMTVQVKTTDLDPVENTIEAGFDYFFVSNNSVTELSDVWGEMSKLQVSPNPSADFLYLQTEITGFPVLIFNSFGQVLFKIEEPTNKEKIDIHFLGSGCYFVQQGDQRKKFIKK